MSQTFDVIVVGVGAVGSATCYHLAKLGLRVLGLEQFAIPHNLGGSHGNSRQTKIAPYIGSPYEPIIKRSYELYQALIEESGATDIMVTTGFLDVHRNRDFPGYKTQTGYFEELDLKEIRKRFPQFQLTEPYWAAWDPVGALLRPEITITSYVRLASELGATIQAHTTVKNWRVEKGGVSVETDRGTFSADRVVFCAGPWSGKVLSDLDIRMTANRMSFGWFWPLRNSDAFKQDKMPCWCIDDDAGIYYGFPMMNDVPGYKVGLHWNGEEIDPDNFDRKPNALDEERMRAGLRKFFPDADGPLLAVRTCLYDHTSDDVPIIDKHPDHDRVTICGPLCSAGFKFVPAYAEAAAELAATGDTKLPIDFLRFARLLPTRKK